MRLLPSAGDVMPMTFGTRRPVIVLPASADEWTDDRRRAVLLHELAHVARRRLLRAEADRPGVRALLAASRRLVGGAAAAHRARAGVRRPGARGRRAAARVRRSPARSRALARRGAGARDRARHGARAAARAAPARRPRCRAQSRGAAPSRPTLAARARRAMLFLPMAACAPPSSRSMPPPAAVAPGARRLGAQDFTGTWDAPAGADPGMINVTVRTPHGLTAERSGRSDARSAERHAHHGANGAMHFPIRREAGTFTVDGVCRRGCAAAPTPSSRPGLPRRLAKRGIGAPTRRSNSSWRSRMSASRGSTSSRRPATRSPTSTAWSAPRSTASRVVRPEMAASAIVSARSTRWSLLRDHGVDPEYVRGMAAAASAGRRATTSSAPAITASIPEYVGGSRARLQGLSSTALITARDHGVDPEYVRGLAALGFKGLPLDGLIGARDHGVDPNTSAAWQRSATRASRSTT